MNPALSPSPPRPAEFDGSILPLMARLKRQALVLARNRCDADDLVQETLLRALRHWPSFEPGTNLKAWLLRIMMNTYINGYRRARLDAQRLKRLSQAQESADAAESRLHRRLFSTLDERTARRWSKLPDRDRTLLRLIHRDELSYEDAARSMQCPIGTVMSRVHRARRALSA